MLVSEDHDMPQHCKAIWEAKASGVLSELESEPRLSAALGKWCWRHSLMSRYLKS